MQNIQFSVNEIFNSIQGEGGSAGLYCTFVRFAGCNLKCKFCDTNHSERFILDLDHMVKLIQSYTPRGGNLVFTGGEPLLQGINNLTQLMAVLLDHNVSFHLETNGTIDLPPSVYTLFDSISMSPKTQFSDIKLSRCHNLKLVFPYINDLTPDKFKGFLAGEKFIHPICPQNVSGLDLDAYREVILEAIEELKSIPKYWRLDLQQHKLIQVP